jgi:hypothetical protein
MSVLSLPFSPNQRASQPARRAPPPVPSHPLARRGARPSRPAGAHAEARAPAREPSQRRRGGKPILPLSLVPVAARAERGRAPPPRAPGGPSRGGQHREIAFPCGAAGSKSRGGQAPGSHRHQPALGFLPLPRAAIGRGKRRRGKWGRGGEAGDQRSPPPARRRCGRTSSCGAGREGRRRSWSRRSRTGAEERAPPWTPTPRRHPRQACDVYTADPQ